MSDFELQHTIITQTAKGVRVESLYADAPIPDEASKKLLIIFPIETDEYPRIPELELKALENAQAAISNEIRRIGDVARNIHRRP